MKRTVQKSVLNFLNKKSKCEVDRDSSSTRTTVYSQESLASPSVCSQSMPQDFQLPAIHPEASILYERDVGRYLKQPPQNDEDKFKALSEPWIPPCTYQFPISTDRHLSFQRHWMTQYNWLVYTDYLQGALCKVCVLFGSGFGGRGQQQLGALVKKPFTNWRHAKEKFEKHEKAEYHQFAVEQAEGFFPVISGKNQNVIEALSTENRKKLTAIVETVILCGRQEIALRGDCEDGLTGPLHNDGNFKALLRYRACSGDEALESHLQTSDNRSMYTSIQNEIVELCGNSVQESIIRRIKHKGPGYFSILANETRDSSRQQQLSLCVRYLDISGKKSIVREDFIEFVHVDDLSASALATTIMERLVSHGLDPEMMVGQGYDGAAIMSGRLKGVRTLIREQYPKARFVHCAAHTLSLVLAHSSEVAMIRNCVGTVKNVINFFRQSSSWNTVLKGTAGEKMHSQLVALCETRWTEKHEAVSRFVETFNAIVEALHVLGNDGRDSQAYQFIDSLENCQFVISLLILNKVFSYTSSLNVALQMVGINLNEEYKHAETVIEALEAIRRDPSDAVFYNIIEEAKNLLGSTEIMAPRPVSKQTCGSNVPANTPEQYYKRNVFYPFLDHVIEELNARFASPANIIGNLQILAPGFFIDDAACHLQLLQNLYLNDVTSETLKAEYDLWKRKWAAAECAVGVLETYDECNEFCFPNIKTLLGIFAVIPVTTATPERTFSSVKRVKTYLRNRTGQQRLTGLALMAAHRDITISSTEIIYKLASCRKRLNLIL